MNNNNKKMIVVVYIHKNRVNTVTYNRSWHNNFILITDKIM